MNRKQTGFTLVEMMIVLVIAGIIVSAAVPSFQGMVIRNRIATTTNDMILALTLARSEALRQGTRVSVRAAAPVEEDEFGGGFCVATGEPADCSGAVIRRFDAMNEEFTMDSVDDVEIITFNSLGGLVGTVTRSIDVCFGTDEEFEGRRIVIAIIGRSKSHSPSDPDAARHPDCT